MTKEKLQEEINKELGYVSALFMSQGDTRAGDIVMPSTELLETLDRIMLYVFAHSRKIEQDKAKETLEAIIKEVEGIKDEYAGEEHAFNNGLQAMKQDVLTYLQTQKELIEKEI